MQGRRTETGNDSIRNTRSSTGRSRETGRKSDWRKHNAKSTWEKHWESFSSFWPQICGKGGLAMQFQDESRSLLQAFNEFVYCAVDRDFIWGFGKQAIHCVPVHQDDNIMHTGPVLWTMWNDPSQVVLHQDCYSLPRQHVVSYSKSACYQSL